MSDIARASANTIGAALARAAARHAQRTALVYAERNWTFAELERSAERVAGWLRELGLKPGDRVAAYGRNSDAYFVLWLGCATGGFVHVPVNYALTGDELRYIVLQSGARALFYDSELRANFERLERPEALAVVGSLRGGSEADVLAAALDPSRHALEFDAVFGSDDVVQLLYTSGTTAAPKGAMMTHRGLLAEYASCIYELEFRSEDRALAALPLYHTAQMHVFTMPQLLVGATTVLFEGPEPQAVLACIERAGITSFFAPPTVWIGLLRHPDFERRNLSSLRRLYYGASIMPTPVLAELRARLPHALPYNCYGQTEIAPLATVLRPEEHEARPASCGRPVFGVQTRVVDPTMRDVAAGVHGEIVHRSPQLMSGYWDKPLETAEAFAGAWFHSGDVGFFDEGGYLYIVDRIKDVINTGGVLVASREVEEALYAHPAVSEVAVIALPDAKWIEAVTAIVVLRDGGAANEAELVAHARATLAAFKVPKRVFFVDALPRNTAGKLLKRELRARFAGVDSAVMSPAGAVLNR